MSCIDEFTSYLKANKQEIDKSKKQLPNRKTPYFVVYCSLKDRLLSLSHGAVKLYLYCGFSINYKSGYFISSYDCLSTNKYLASMSRRKLRSCINELVTAGLIYIKTFENKMYIFIRPYDTDICFYDDDSIDTLSYKYSRWVESMKLRDQEAKVVNPFFFIPKTFMEYYWERLPQPGSITLYLYCGICMYKSEGYLNKSLPAMSKELGVTRKTIILWFKDLEDNKLVLRHQLSLNTSSCTHLLPIKSGIRKKSSLRHNTDSLKPNEIDL